MKWSAWKIKYVEAPKKITVNAYYLYLMLGFPHDF